MYIYPENLTAKATMWLWTLKDLSILIIGCLFSVFALVQTGAMVPLVVTATYGFLTIRFSDASVMDFLRYAMVFFITKQQQYEWRMS